MRKRNAAPDEDPRPKFFGDRPIGKRVYEALIADGWLLTPMFVQWPRSENRKLDDDVWIPKVTEFGWIILSKDEFDKGRERLVLRTHGARAFSIFNQQLKTEAMVERFLNNKERIYDLANEPGPYLYAVQPTDLRKIGLP